MNFRAKHFGQIAIFRSNDQVNQNRKNAQTNHFCDKIPRPKIIVFLDLITESRQKQKNIGQRVKNMLF